MSERTSEMLIYSLTCTSVKLLSSRVCVTIGPIVSGAFLHEENAARRHNVNIINSLRVISVYSITNSEAYIVGPAVVCGERYCGENAFIYVLYDA